MRRHGSHAQLGSGGYLLMLATYVYSTYDMLQSSAGILEQSLGERNRVGLPARQARLAESIP
jgi:hypothetical protein